MHEISGTVPAVKFRCSVETYNPIATSKISDFNNRVSTDAMDKPNHNVDAFHKRGLKGKHLSADLLLRFSLMIVLVLTLKGGVGTLAPVASVSVKV